MRALYFGTYDRDHPRNVNAIAALRAAGVEVEERQVAVRGGGLLGALDVFAAERRLFAPSTARLRCRDRRLPRPLRRAARAARRPRPPARLRRRALTRGRARRGAAAFRSRVDGRERPARRRLPRVAAARPGRLRDRRRGALPVERSGQGRRPSSSSARTRTSSARRGRRRIRSAPLHARRRPVQRLVRVGGAARPASRCSIVAPRRDRHRRPRDRASRTRASCSAASASRARSRPSSSTRSRPARR